MILIVGLGNPGKKFQKTRHNLGFRVVDELRSSPHFATARAVDEFAKKNGFPDFEFNKNSSALISKKTFGKEKIILVKPQTFMNNSGQSVKLLLEKLNNSAMAELMSLSKKLFVVHDDIDLLLGKMRIVKNRGAGGHKGVESIIKELKSKNFIRFRIGIKPQRTENKEQKTEKFVLEKFNKEEEKTVREVIKKTAKAIEFFLKEGLEKTMNKFNK